MLILCKLLLEKNQNEKDKKHGASKNLRYLHFILMQTTAL